MGRNFSQTVLFLYVTILAENSPLVFVIFYKSICLIDKKETLIKYFFVRISHFNQNIFLISRWVQNPLRRACTADKYNLEVILPPHIHTRISCRHSLLLSACCPALV